MEKDIDITLFGATGFTGKLTAGVLAKKMNESQFVLGLAGRNQSKLIALQSELKEICPAGRFEILIADSMDSISLSAMAKRSKIVITTVGPYLKYGEPMIKACIAEKAHYLDITGEGAFVHSMIERYHISAKDSKVKILNCCGYDSIPADLGTYFAVKQFSGTETLEVECFINFSSNLPNPFTQLESISGGTWHSAIGFMNSSELDRQVSSFDSIAKQAGERKVYPIPTQFRFREKDNMYGAPLPFVDIEIVLRSAAHLKSYGPDFSYGHYAAISSTPALLVWLLGLGTIFTLAQIPFTKKLLLTLKEPGDGPSKEVRDSNSFCHSFIAKSPSYTIHVEVRGGDPGYGDTSKMLAETALSILQDNIADEYGFITPAIACGDFLINRLINAGISFTIVK